MKKVFRAISVFLVLSIMFSSMSEIIVKATDGPTYISEVKMAYASDTSSASVDAAKRSLSNAGYTVIDNNFNDGTGRVASFIGYKTTKNEKEAITDLKVMDMDGGYELNNYSATLNYYKSSIQEKANGLKAAASEMKSNYEKGSPAAKLAMQTLNYMVVKEKNNQSLGNYLIDTKRSDTEFYNIVLKCDPSILIFIISQLSLGVADYKTKTWIEKYVKINPASLSTDGYHSRAMKIYPRVKEFEAKYKAAVEATQQSGETNTSAAKDTSSSASRLEDAINSNPSQETTTVSPEMVKTLTAYDMLNQYTVNGDGVGDIFVDLFSATELYPLVAALTTGQLAILENSDIETFALNLANATGTGLEIYDQTSALIEKEAGPIKGVDLWENTVEEVFEDKEIAMTTDAIRQATAENNLNAITKTDSTKKIISQTFTILGSVTFVAMGVAQAAWLAISSAVGIKFTFATILTTLGTAFSTTTGAAIAVGIFSGGIVVLALCVLALVGIAIYYLVQWIKDEIEYNNPTYKDIPTSMYDYFKDVPDPDEPDGIVSRFVGYEVVTELSGKPSDLNAWNGLKWNALYYTKNPVAGSPITTDFIVKYKDGITPVGYSSLSKYGEVIAFNANTHMRQDTVGGIFVFFKRKDGNKAAVKGEYLFDIVVQEGASENEVMSLFKTKGYTPLKTNLLASGGLNNNNRVAYLGYKTTKNVRDAIVDIRVGSGCNTKQIFIGEASYANAGTYLDMTLFYAKNKESVVSGDPILADFFISNTISNVPPSADFVPISLISGGPAVNLTLPIKPLVHTGGFRSDKYDNSNLPQVYIYYKSSVTYDKGPDYISGFAFFQSQDKENDDKATQLMKASGYTHIGRDITNGSGAVFYYKNRMAYSTTKNKFRALKKVFTFHSEEGSASMLPFTMRDGIGYIAAPRFDVVAYNYSSGGQLSVEYTKYHNAINATNTLVQYYKSTAMYVTSNTSQGEYFTINDIYFRTSYENPNSGFYGVPDWYDANYYPSNIKNGCWTTDKLFMYIRGNKTVAPKYINKIIVGNSEHGDSYAKLDLFNQGATEISNNSDEGEYMKGSDEVDIYTRLGFGRGDDFNYAITGLKVVAYDNDKKPTSLPEKVMVSKISYVLASQNPFAYNEDYCGLYIYYTTDPAAGEPITDVLWVTDIQFLSLGYETTGYLDDKWLLPNCTSIKTLANSGEYSEILYVKTVNTSSNAYIKSIGAVDNSSYRNGMFELASLGFSYVGKGTDGIAFDMNDTSGGDSVLVGYNKTHNKDDSITGIIASVQSGGMPTVLTYNGIKYSSMTRWSNFNTNSTNSYPIYLYYTKDPRAGSPITDILCGWNSYQSGWSTVINTSGNAANFNEGDYSCDTPDSIYLYYKRANGVISNRSSAKFASVFITGNPVAAVIGFTSLLLTGAILIVYQRRRRRKVKI